MRRVHWIFIIRRRLRIIMAIIVLLLGIGIYWQLNQKNIDTWSWVIGNQTIVIDAGHGGVDPGAVSKNQTLEKDINLEVAKYLKVYLTQGGAKPVMIRETDSDLGTAQGLLKRKREDLAKRIEISDQSQADVYLSIHVNSFPNEKLSGPQTFYHVDCLEGKKLAQKIQTELNNVAQGKRVAKSNQDYFVLKRSNKPAVTIELGFISNAQEEQLLTDSAYQQKLAWAIYKGLCHYYAD